MVENWRIEHSNSIETKDFRICKRIKMIFILKTTFELKMKRTIESVEEDNITKHVKIDNDSSNDSSIDSSSDSSSDSDIEIIPPTPIDENSFVPTTIEKQIIRQTLAGLNRANMSDWNPEVGYNYMMLRLPGIFEDDEKIHCCDIVVVLERELFTTYCKIMYIMNGTSFELFLSWDTQDSYFITIHKFIQVQSYLLFSKTVKQSSIFDSRKEDNYWCFFDDVRRHLKRIAN